MKKNKIKKNINLFYILSNLIFIDHVSASIQNFDPYSYEEENTSQQIQKKRICDDHEGEKAKKVKIFDMAIGKYVYDYLSSSQERDDSFLIKKESKNLRKTKKNDFLWEQNLKNFTALKQGEKLLPDVHAKTIRWVHTTMSALKGQNNLKLTPHRIQQLWSAGFMLQDNMLGKNHVDNGPFLSKVQKKSSEEILVQQSPLSLKQKKSLDIQSVNQNRHGEPNPSYGVLDNVSRNKEECVTQNTIYPPHLAARPPCPVHGQLPMNMVQNHSSDGHVPIAHNHNVPQIHNPMVGMGIQQSNRVTASLQQPLYPLYNQINATSQSGINTWTGINSVPITTTQINNPMQNIGVQNNGQQNFLWYACHIRPSLEDHLRFFLSRGWTGFELFYSSIRLWQESMRLPRTF